MTVDHRESHPTLPTSEPTSDVGPLGILPWLSGRQVRSDRRLGRSGPALVADLVEFWNELIGGGLLADRFDVEWRAAGLKRPGLVAQLAWPRLRTRVALGVDPPLAHAVVDRLLGFSRTPAEARLQVSPVEWGVLSFLVASGLDRLEQLPGPLGPWDLTIDRVGPDPFRLTALGLVVTWRWRVQLGGTVGTVRLWLPESLLGVWLDDPANLPWPKSGPPPRGTEPRSPPGWSRFHDLTSEFRAEVGSVTLAAGSFPSALGPGRLVLLDDRPLAGTVASPQGIVRLAQDDRVSRVEFQAQVEPGSAGDRLVLTSNLKKRPTIRKPLMADSPPTDPRLPDSVAAATGPSTDRPDPGDLAVTLTVELGRVNLPLARLAELRAGDVIELARHGREPVDLSSNGRLVARGELVQVDTELGVRILQIFL